MCQWLFMVCCSYMNSSFHLPYYYLQKYMPCRISCLNWFSGSTSFFFSYLDKNSVKSNQSDRRQNRYLMDPTTSSQENYDEPHFTLMLPSFYFSAWRHHCWVECFKLIYQPKKIRQTLWNSGFATQLGYCFGISFCRMSSDYIWIPDMDNIPIEFKIKIFRYNRMIY